MSNNIVMAFSPRNIVGCLLKKRITRVAGGGGGGSPSYALDSVLICLTCRFINRK